MKGMHIVSNTKVQVTAGKDIMLRDDKVPIILKRLSERSVVSTSDTGKSLWYPINK